MKTLLNICLILVLTIQGKAQTFLALAKTSHTTPILINEISNAKFYLASNSSNEVINTALALPPTPNLSATSSSIVAGGSATLSVSNCTGTLNWNNNLGVGTSKTVSPTMSTLYIVSCTDGSGTSPTASKTITVTSTGVTQSASISVITPITGGGTRTDTRTFTFHLPIAIPVCNLPLMIVYHGDGGSGAGIESATGMDGVADTQNFIAVYPNAIAGSGYGAFSYEIDKPLYFNGQIDSTFTLALIDYFYKNYGINRNKVYATGHSSGGNMVYFASAKLFNNMAAFAPASSFPQDYSDFSAVWTGIVANATTPKVPLMHIHGTADTGGGTEFTDTNLPNPYPATPTNNSSNPYIWPMFPLSNKNCSNGTGSYTATAYNSNATVDKLIFCSTPEISMLIVRGLAHAWPTAANANGLDGSQAVWNFVKNYQLSAFTAPTAAISPASATYTGTPITLTASGCGTLGIKWSNNATTSAISVSPVTTTNYTVICQSLITNCQVGNTSVTATVMVGGDNNPCSGTVSVTTAAYPNYTANQVVQAQYITTSSPPAIIINSGNSSNLTYQAGNSVTLNSGFSVQNGAIFKAQIGSCANPTLQVNGRFLYDSNNQPVILRGVNYPVLDDWNFPTSDLITEIEKSGANAVRLQWYINYPSRPTYTATDLDNLLTKCKNNKIIPILMLSDFTSGADMSVLNSQVVPWWTSAGMLNVINTHKKHLIINLANELGQYRWQGSNQSDVDAYKNAYKTAITSMRNAGVDVPLMIDAPDGASTLSVFLSIGQELINYDPKHNLLLSVHGYWAAYNGMSEIATAVTNNLPIVFGEIANKQDEYVNNANAYCYYNLDGTNDAPNNPIANAGFTYQNLLTTLQNQSIGWLAWAWVRDGCSYRNMTNNDTNNASFGKYSSLTTYGNNVVNNATYGIKNTSVRSNGL